MDSTATVEQSTRVGEEMAGFIERNRDSLEEAARTMRTINVVLSLPPGRVARDLVGGGEDEVEGPFLSMVREAVGGKGKRMSFEIVDFSRGRSVGEAIGELQAEGLVDEGWKRRHELRAKGENPERVLVVVGADGIPGESTEANLLLREAHDRPTILTICGEPEHDSVDFVVSAARTYVLR
jgi:hypothetical protein